MNLLLMLTGALAGDVDTYAARAVERHPVVKAEFHRWQAAVERIATARSLPQPRVRFDVFVRSVETRVGPQQARISVSQAFPWPGELVAEGKGATAEADAAARVLEARTLSVVREVEEVYWTLWQLREARTLHREHLEILAGLSAAVGARVETGAATLADLQQVDLSRARLDDRLRSLDTAERTAIAALTAHVGTASAWPSRDLPSLARPSGDPTIATNPAILALGERVEAAEADARATTARRLPTFTVGADWIVTGPAVADGVPDSGKDAIALGAGITVPLWQGPLGKAAGAARSEALARREDQRAAEDEAVAALTSTLAGLEDSARRARLVSGVLLPQAEAAYSSLLANYVVGRGSVAQILLAQRDLLDLAVEGKQALADHQRAWAALDQIVGREVPRVAVQESP